MNNDLKKFNDIKHF